jgi:AcrR family transcriptional regulator
MPPRPPASRAAPGSDRRHGRPVRAAEENTRDRVLASARRAFGTQGFAGATMRGIAAEAGVTAMALYNYAPSKAALFEAVWRGSIEAIYTDYEQVVAGRDSLLDELDALLDRSRDVLVDNPDHIRFVARVLMDRGQVGLSGADLGAPMATEFFERLAGRSVERGEIATRDRDRLVRFVVTLLWGITTYTAFDPGALDATVDASKWAVRRQLLASRLPG